MKSIEADRPGEILAMDLLEGLPASWGGKSYVLVISDFFTKYPPVREPSSHTYGDSGGCFA